MKTIKSIGIIGGGASGLMAAIAAAGNKNVHVFLLEHKERPGKKILSTGNGRCNLTNEQMSSSFYRSEDMESVQAVLKSFGYEDTIRIFDELGLVCKSRDGYVYPFCSQASAVLDVLLMEIRRLGAEIFTGGHVAKVQADVLAGKEIFHIFTDKREFSADKIILATGGRAAEKLGSDGSGYALAQSFGHSLSPVLPALVQLKVKSHPFKKAAGVRADAAVTAYAGDRRLASDAGEVQITDYGISGIPVFQISRYIAEALYEKREACVEIDFMPQVSEEELFSFLLKRAEHRGRMEAQEYLTGIFHSKLIPAFLSLADIPPRIWIYKVLPLELKRLAEVIKHTRLAIADTRGFENAQVCAGGVRLQEIDCKTMESSLKKGLYITGELLDADGMCGGYNLQWAWATGYLAGRHAARTLI